MWIKTEVKTPPCSSSCRQQIGRLIRDLQEGQVLSMPDSKPMPTIGKNCHELRVFDKLVNCFWRLIYFIDSDAIVILELYAKKTQKIPKQVIETCQQRLKYYLKTIS